MARATRQQERRWDGSGAILFLFGMALAVGVLAGFGAQRFVQDYGRPQAIYHGSTPKQVIELGYTSENQMKADHAHERAVIEKLLAAPVGTQMLWENVETGNRGVVWVAGQRVAPDGGVCRDLVRHTLLNKTYRNTAGTTCRPANAGYPDEVPWHAE